MMLLLFISGNPLNKLSPFRQIVDLALVTGINCLSLAFNKVGKSFARPEMNLSFHSNCAQ